jgi:hypothetical protein
VSLNESFGVACLCLLSNTYLWHLPTYLPLMTSRGSENDSDTLCLMAMMMRMVMVLPIGTSLTRRRMSLVKGILGELGQVT